MKIDVVTYTPFPIEAAFLAMRDQMVALGDYMPNIEKITVESREEPAEGEVKLINRWQAANSEIPAVARSFVKPEQMYWLDHAHWTRHDYLCCWRLEMAFMPERIRCTGTTSYHTVGDRTEMRIKGELELDLKGLVPRLVLSKATSAVEGFVSKLIQPNFQKTADALTAYLTSQAG